MLLVEPLREIDQGPLASVSDVAWAAQIENRRIARAERRTLERARRES
jgi:hypothetical protein